MKRYPVVVLGMPIRNGTFVDPLEGRREFDEVDGIFPLKPPNIHIMRLPEVVVRSNRDLSGTLREPLLIGVLILESCCVP